MRTFLKVFFAAAIVAGFSSSADAASISCPVGGLDDVLQVTYTGTSATCVDSGHHPPDQFPNASDDPLNGAPYIGDCIVASTTCDYTGSTSGNWSIDGAPGDFLVLWKFGGGQNNPNWFLLSFVGLAAGTHTYNLIGGDVENGLSHLAVWGETTDEEPPPVVPEPASLLLLGTGLLGAAALRRRKVAKH